MLAEIGKQAAASVTGNVETALLIIHDYREKAAKLDAAPGAGPNELSTAAVLKRVRVVDTAAALATGVPPTYPSSKDRMFKVQFNPSELLVNADAIPRSEEDSVTGRSRTMAVEDAKLNLTVKLYFDDMQVFDAFMWDKFASALTVNGAAANIAGAVKADKGRIHSVQGQVEALVAALRNPYTRTISFRWADLVFTGMLNTVRANYTMFSPSGRPVRAEVLLRIQHEMDPPMLHSWYESFEKAFGGETNNLVKPEQTTENLLNLAL